MTRNRCNAVYVVLGEQEEDDRLERCVTSVCEHHQVELEWVRADPDRLARYNDQLRRFDLGQQIADRLAVGADQGSLL